MKKKEQPIQPTKDEIYAFNVLNGTCEKNQQELNQSIQARDAYIKLMEIKYQAKYDPMTGTLVKPVRNEGVKDGD